ncbi:hypothetical protein SK066_16370 [Paenibacillus hunanensis]|uniref:hypothetical protein n=1 Tax=Paenibacillus hunanensis TaxID=539262 RepID=UPI002026DF66|nr:hypothetical protein [Paenibacillus hunanensis]MCL9659138.1 hypothetical protein [Paenibacillus hunanensis]WPP40177.1 hypothetical protein SK066_16370 [Paenibacillus hunanensis]
MDYNNAPPGYPPQPGQPAPVISVKEWMITLLLLAIPLVNLIMLFIWAFGGGTNISKSNYAKAALLWAAIWIVVYIIFFVLFGAAMFAGFSRMENMPSSY